jgi:hypothetical protein
MYKRWLSQALEHAAFPLVVLAIAVGQVNTNHHSEPSLLRRAGELLEPRQSDLGKQSLREYRLRTRRGNPPAAEGSPWQNEPNGKD